MLLQRFWVYLRCDNICEGLSLWDPIVVNSGDSLLVSQCLIITSPPRTCTSSTSSIHKVHMDTPHQMPPHTTPTKLPSPKPKSHTIQHHSFTNQNHQLPSVASCVWPHLFAKVTSSIIFFENNLPSNHNYYNNNQPLIHNQTPSSSAGLALLDSIHICLEHTHKSRSTLQVCECPSGNKARGLQRPIHQTLLPFTHPHPRSGCCLR